MKRDTLKIYSDLSLKLRSSIILLKIRRNLWLNLKLSIRITIKGFLMTIEIIFIFNV